MSAKSDTSDTTAASADGGSGGVSGPDAVARRQRWMSALAKTDPRELARYWASLPDLPEWQRVRAPETGMVMTRGRIGGDGRRFNLGEVTVTRCTVLISDGAARDIVGHAYVMGRDKTHAERAAVLDALMQEASWASRLERPVIRRLMDAAAARRAVAARKSGATKVDFTTVTRGED